MLAILDNPFEGIKVMFMKTNLKLTQLESQRLSAAEASAVKGGYVRECSCSCYYSDSGGSSIEANGMANYSTGSNGASSPNGSTRWHRRTEFAEMETELQP